MYCDAERFLGGGISIVEFQFTSVLIEYAIAMIRRENELI